MGKSHISGNNPASQTVTCRPTHQKAKATPFRSTHSAAKATPFQSTHYVEKATSCQLTHQETKTTSCSPTYSVAKSASCQMTHQETKTTSCSPTYSVAKAAGRVTRSRFNTAILMTAVAVLTMGAVGCKPAAGVAEQPFGELSTGEKTVLYTVTNTKGASMQLLDYGARIVSINVPDRDGKLGDVVVGFSDLYDFEHTDRYIGPVIGRFGNRIDNASFDLDGVHYEVDANEKFDGEPVQCHGGHLGFDRFVWEGTPVEENGRRGVKFHRLSPDGEQGFPGNMDTYVTYWLTDDNTVKIEYEATTDKPTVVNLSNHTYFNLKGNEGGYVMDHLLQVEADTCVQNNTHFCPDLLLPVEGTPFDFREPHRVDYRIDMPNEHLRIMHGMSACWVIRGWDGTLRKAADLYDRYSGRGVETWTTEPALLTFTGRSFNGTYKGKYGPIEKFGGMLLETIHFPDSPNQPRFPSTVLRPGEKFYSTTEFRFYSN